MKRTLLTVTLSLILFLSSTAMGFDRRYGNALMAYGRFDFATAWQELQPLVKEGHADAQALLGEMYYKGDGLIQDYGRALKLFRLSAKQGSYLGQHGLSLMYFNGHGVPQNYVNAHMWSNIAALSFPPAAETRDEITAKMSTAQISEAQSLARKCIEQQYKGC